MDTIASRVLGGLRRELGAQLLDRRSMLSSMGVYPPARPGGSVAAAAFVVHHTAGAVSDDYAAIVRYHCVSKGWDSPGYGIFVRPSGVVELGVLPDRLTYGVIGRHSVTYNVCLPGNYTRDRATSAQLDALYRVLCCLDDAYGGDGRIWRGHSEWSLRGHGTACPGTNLLPHVQLMRAGQYGAARPRPRHYTATP